MRAPISASVASAVLLIGFAASTSAQSVSGPPDSPAIIAGRVSCFEEAGTASLQLDVAADDGGAIGLLTSSGGIEVFLQVAGTCVDAIAPLTAQLPSPLCSTGPSGTGFNFVCSGGVRSVVGVVGELMKSMLGP